VSFNSCLYQQTAGSARIFKVPQVRRRASRRHARDSQLEMDSGLIQ
jgi:hypothetical protein